MTRELKLALIVGFSLVLVVTVLISDHLSKARQVHLAEVSDQQPALVSAPTLETAPAIPPPSEPRPSPRLAFDPPRESSPAALHTEIVQSRTGGVFTAPSGAGDPDRQLAEHIRQHGGEIVERPYGPEIVLKDPINTAAATSPAVSPLPSPVPERAHTVAEGDSLCKIAKQYYGDENAWRKLAAANSGITPESMKIGMKIKLPPSEQITGKPTPPAPPAPVLAMNQRPAAKAPGTPPLLKTSTVNVKPEQPKSKYASYTVKKGDTVTEIARRQLGSPGRADELLRLNQTVIEDEDSLQTGMVLKLPLT